MATFEEAAIEALLLCRGNAEMALEDTWDRSDDGFSDQIEIVNEALALADQGLVQTALSKLEGDQIPPFYVDEEE